MLLLCDVVEEGKKKRGAPRPGEEQDKQKPGVEVRRVLHAPKLSPWLLVPVSVLRCKRQRTELCTCSARSITTFATVCW